MAGHKITKKQKAYLDSLICQRLSAEDGNKRLVENFWNSRNPGLVRSLQKGWYADSRDELAYYIVKDPEGNLLLFFSLKCGILYVPIFYQTVREKFQQAETLYNAMTKGKGPKWAMDELEKRKVNGVLPAQVRMEITRNYLELGEEWRYLERELKDDGVKILRTHKTYPGVELVHFCANEAAAALWRKAGMNRQSMGKTLFWQFVEPKIQQIRGLLGCEYIYLFAADGSEERTLISYYKGLGFERRDDVGVAKPEYDFGCTFMCQKLTSLKGNRSAFFNAYNGTPETENS